MRYLLSILILLPLSINAQTLQGIVRDSATRQPLYAVTVVNITTQQAVLTDKGGLYVISAREGDRMAFSYVGYKTVQRVKPPSVIIATVNIYMKQTGYKLDEVKVRPYQLTQYQIDSLERHAIYKVPLQRTHPNPIMNPASALADLFCKKSKMVYAFQKNFAAGETEKFIDTRYYPELVTELTGLTGDSIGHFMYACQMPYDFARTASDLEIKMWIRSHYRAWLKTQTTDSAVAKGKMAGQ